MGDTGMNFSYRVSHVVFGTIFRTIFPTRFLDVAHVPLTGPVILACNHASFIDPPLIGAGVGRHINFLARDTLFPVPIVGALLRSWRVVPVDREGGGARGLKNIMDRLQQGGAILLFPEGTRTSDGQLRPARSGIGLTVIKSKAPTIPVRIFGTFEAYSRHHKFPRPHRLTVKFGPPLLFTELRAEAEICSKPRLKEIYQQVADEIMTAIGRLTPDPS